MTTTPHRSSISPASTHAGAMAAETDVTAPIERLAANPLVRPSDIAFTLASGAFNPGATVDHVSGRVVLLVRVFERDTRRSSLALAVSDDGARIDEILDQPAVGREAPYEEWGVEDPRITWLAGEGRYAITYTGYSPAGPRVCLITTDDLLAPERYRRHGPRIAGDNKNCVVFPERVDGAYVILHRPMPCAECVRVRALEDEWPAHGTTLLGPRPGTWRSSRVGAGAPPIRTDVGWLLPFHGATSIEEGNVYSMGWCVLDLKNPEKVLYVSDAPALTPEAPYEIEHSPIPQADMPNCKTGGRVVCPRGLDARGEGLVVDGARAGGSMAAARVDNRERIDSPAEAIKRVQGGTPLWRPAWSRDDARACWLWADWRGWPWGAVGKLSRSRSVVILLRYRFGSITCATSAWMPSSTGDRFGLCRSTPKHRTTVSSALRRGTDSRESPVSTMWRARQWSICV